MTEAEIKSIASAAAKEAVKEVLEVLGLDVSTPGARQEVVRDFLHLRSLRLAGKAIGDKLISAAAGAFVTFIGGAALYYVMHGPK